MPFDPEQEKADRKARMHEAGVKGRIGRGGKVSGTARSRSGFKQFALNPPSERALMVREGEKERKCQS